MAAQLLLLPKLLLEPVPCSTPDLSNTRLRDFVGPQSWFLFQLLNQTEAKNDWLPKDPATWNAHPKYVEMETIVRAMPGVNDFSERACRLATDMKVNDFFF